MFSAENIFAQADFYYTVNSKKVNLTKISGKYVVEYTSPMIDTTFPGIKLRDQLYVVIDTTALHTYGNNYIVYAHLSFK